MNQEEIKEGIIKKSFRFVKNHKFFIVITVFLCVFIVFLIFNDKGFLSRAKLEKENNELIKQIQEDSIEGIKLDNEINKLKTSDKKIEQVAREKYKMSKKGEKIFQIKVDSTK